MKAWSIDGSGQELASPGVRMGSNIKIQEPNGEASVKIDRSPNNATLRVDCKALTEDQVIAIGKMATDNKKWNRSPLNKISDQTINEIVDKNTLNSRHVKPPSR